MTIETLQIDTEVHSKLATALLGNLVISGHLPSLLDYRSNTLLGEIPIVRLTGDQRALYQALYPLVNGFLANRQELFGMFPVDLQLHTDRKTGQSLTIVLGFGEVKPHWPVYVSFSARWVEDEFEMKLRNTAKPRTPWNILVDWAPDWVKEFEVGKYLTPDAVIDIVRDIESQFRLYNGYHNAGVIEDVVKDVFWRSCYHYAQPVLNETKRWAKLTTTIELREGAYEFAYHLKEHATVEDGEEWGI